ncbi:hypothetical protein B4135_3000 [Caldibacillus debilis]|uniref:Uncharacterized protein n=1 Tax=Caldibacillus debilis TaxID=301148 RepID=A0A150LM26_9BACI|nr:hypothetical protein B4135_3000 [Caldibacillus debilis]
MASGSFPFRAKYVYNWFKTNVGDSPAPSLFGQNPASSPVSLRAESKPGFFLQRFRTGKETPGRKSARKQNPPGCRSA